MHTHTHAMFYKSSGAACYSRLYSKLVILPLCHHLRFSQKPQKTHYENINLQKDQKGQHELLIPHYHELVPKEAEKKVRIDYCVCVAAGPHKLHCKNIGVYFLPEGQFCCIASSWLTPFVSAVSCFSFLTDWDLKTTIRMGNNSYPVFSMYTHGGSST